MVPGPAERSWLFDPQLLKLVHQCRRLIQAEFGVKLHLTDDHLEQQLAGYAQRSRSSQLASLWKRLEPCLPQGYEVEAEEPQKRRYRGQVLLQDSTGAEPAAPRKPRTIVYRGQVVTQH
ncbi:MAG: hypothetical protein LAT63_12940 [Marinobacter sp.]|nr:hypothetical protein [Marinobacter sp.]